ncbi:MAG: hypothetical protein Q8K36_02130, partial [Alphaproteobacteria bacterium]|nr:hypothetical protein [Alphaproteobacteria bacterium]
DDMSTPESGDETPPVASGTSAAERASDQVSTYPVIKTEEVIRLLKGENVFPHLRICHECLTQADDDKTDYSDANIIKGLENGTLIISGPYINPNAGKAFYSIHTIPTMRGHNVLYKQFHAY